jgi:cysteine synthase A
LQHALVDEVMMVSETDTIAGCRALLERHKLFVGGSTGSAYAAIQRRFAQYPGAPPRVLFLCCDRGNAYLDTVFDGQHPAHGEKEAGPLTPSARVV